MKNVVPLIAMSLLLANCDYGPSKAIGPWCTSANTLIPGTCQSPTELRATGPFVDWKVTGERNAVAQCTLRALDEAWPTLDKFLQLNTDIPRADLLIRANGHLAHIVQFTPIENSLSVAIYVSNWPLSPKSDVETIQSAVRSCSGQISQAERW